MPNGFEIDEWLFFILDSRLKASDPKPCFWPSSEQAIAVALERFEKG